MCLSVWYKAGSVRMPDCEPFTWRCRESSGRLLRLSVAVCSSPVSVFSHPASLQPGSRQIAPLRSELLRKHHYSISQCPSVFSRAVRERVVSWAFCFIIVFFFLCDGCPCYRTEMSNGNCLPFILKICLHINRWIVSIFIFDFNYFH